MFALAVSLPLLGVACGYLHPFTVEGTITVEPPHGMFYNATVRERFEAPPFLGPVEFTYKHVESHNPLHMYQPGTLEIPLYRGVEVKVEVPEEGGSYRFSFHIVGEASYTYGILGLLASATLCTLYRGRGGPVACGIAATLSFTVSMVVVFTQVSPHVSVYPA